MSDKVRPITPIIGVRYYSDLNRQYIFRVPHGMVHERTKCVRTSGEGGEEVIDEFSVLMDHARSAMELGTPVAEEEYRQHIKK